MADSKDELLDLIFSAPINLPEVKGKPDESENVASVPEADHDDDDVQLNEQGNEQQHTGAPNEYNDESYQLKETQVMSSFDELIEHNEKFDDHQYEMKHSFAESDEPVPDYNKYDEPQKHDANAPQYVPEEENEIRGKADSGGDLMNDIFGKSDARPAMPMQFNVQTTNVAHDEDNKDEYIEESVHINDIPEDYEPEEPEEGIREHKAEDFLEYEQSQVRRGTELIEEPDFRVDRSVAESEGIEGDYTRAALYDHKEHEEYGSNDNDSVSKYLQSATAPPEETHNEPPSYEPNAFMKKTDYYPESEDKMSRSSRTSSYRAISVRKDSSGSTHHGTFEPNREHSIQDEVNSAPGVTSLKSVFEKDSEFPSKPPRIPRVPRPPVTNYAKEQDYTSQEKVKLKPVKKEEISKPVEQQQQPAEEEREKVRVKKEQEVQVPEQETRFVNIVAVETTEKPITVTQSRPEKLVIPESAKAPTTRVAPTIISPPTISPPAHPVYHPPTKVSPTSPTDHWRTARSVKSVRQFVKVWGKAPYHPGDPHPLSPVPVDIPVAQDKYIIKVIDKVVEKHPVKVPEVLQLAETNEQPNYVSNKTKEVVVHEKRYEQPVKEVHTEKRYEEPMEQSKPNEPDTVYSERTVVDEVMIDDIPVAQRRKLFETIKQPKQSFSAGVQRRLSKSAERAPDATRRSSVLKDDKQKMAAGAGAEVTTQNNESIDENTKQISRDEIEKGTEEIADIVIQLASVAERRSLFEKASKSAKKPFKAI